MFIVKSSSSSRTSGSTPSPNIILQSLHSNPPVPSYHGLNLTTSQPLNAQNRQSNKREKFRPEWQQISIPASEAVIYTFVSYNVLAQAHLVANKYLYRKNKNQHLQWDTRFGKLIDYFEKTPADIYCLQEVEAAHLQQYASYFEHVSKNYRPCDIQIQAS